MRGASKRTPTPTQDLRLSGTFPCQITRERGRKVQPSVALLMIKRSTEEKSETDCVCAQQQQKRRPKVVKVTMSCFNCSSRKDDIEVSGQLLCVPFYPSLLGIGVAGETYGESNSR